MAVSTLINRLIDIEKLLQFSEGEDVYIGINHIQMSKIRAKLKQLKKSVRKLRRQRLQDVKHDKSSRLITPEHLQRYGDSDHIKQIVRILECDKSKALGLVHHCVY